MFPSNLEVFISSNGLKCRTLHDIYHHQIYQDPDFKILTSEGFKKFKITSEEPSKSRFQPLDISLNYDSLILDANSDVKIKNQAVKVKDLIKGDSFLPWHTPIKTENEHKNTFYNKVKPFLSYCFSTLIPSDENIKLCTDLTITSKNSLTEAVKAFYDFSGLDKIDFSSYEENSEYIIEIRNPSIIQNVYDFVLDGTPVIDFTLKERLDLLTEIIKSNNNGNPSGRILICMDFAFDFFKRLITSVGWNYEILSVDKFNINDEYEGFAYTIHIIDNLVGVKNVGTIKKIEKCSDEVLKTLYPVEIEGLTSEGIVLTNGLVV